MLKKKKSHFIHSSLEALVLTNLVCIVTAILHSSFTRAVIAITISSLFLLLFCLICTSGIHASTKKSSILLTGFLTIIEFLTIFLVTIYFLAPELVFWPSCDEAVFQEIKNTEHMESLIIPTSAGNIQGWFLHNAGSKDPVIIYYTGNGETASQRMQFIKDNQSQKLFQGYNLVICSYPGYEYSTGSPSGESLRTMGLGVYDYVAKLSSVDPDNIYIWGFSIGTGLSNYVASERPVKGLLLMAPYSNGYDLYNNFIDIFHGPLKRLVNYHMDAADYAKKVHVKPTILASVNDEIVNYNTSLHLSEYYPSGSTFITYHGLKHNDFWSNPESQNAIKSYFEGELKQ